jgi:hypothetical protein
VVTSSLRIVAWAAAAANDIKFSNRGRVPADVIERYKAAGTNAISVLAIGRC